MNWELSLLSKIVAEKDLGTAIEKGIDEKWFQGFSSLWDFIIDYNEKYGGVPSVRNIKARFEDIDLINVTDTYNYVIDQLRNQNLEIGLRIIADDINSSIDEKKNPQLVMQSILDQSYDLSVSFQESKDVDIIHDYESRAKITRERVAHFEKFDELIFIKSGFTEIDERAPFQDGNLITFIGDTGSLKSYLNQKIGTNIVQHKHVGLLSLEMTSDEVGWRADTIHANERNYDLTNTAIQLGAEHRQGLNLGEYQKMLKEVADDTKYGFWVSDTTGSSEGINSTKAIAKFDHYVRRFGDDFGLFIIDYTTLLEDADDWASIGKITKKLKNTAQRLQKPCIQIAQARRGNRNRQVTRDEVGYSKKMVEDSDKVFTITRESKSHFQILCDKARGNEEGWSFMIEADPNTGLFRVVEDSLDHSF